MTKRYLNLGTTLKRLLFEKNIKAADLARDLNIPPPTIHRIITGKSTRPYKSSLKPIADYFSLSVDELTGEKPTNLNHDPNFAQLSSSKIQSIPLVHWNFLSSPELIGKNKCGIVPFTGNISDKSFATTLEDSSMEPLFPRDSILIFDPMKPFKDRSFVLVQLNQSETMVFRQLLIDTDEKYIKPLNPDLHTSKMRLLSDKDKIVATLIESRQVY